MSRDAYGNFNIRKHDTRGGGVESWRNGKHVVTIR
jgi:hypothetical protein